MRKIDIDSVVRNNIVKLKPYSCARSEYKGKEAIFLDANENPYDNGYNRYPDPLQLDLKKEISKIKNIDINQIFLGNGSDEAIDLIFRIFCNPSKDNMVTIYPSYGMYQVCADINDIETRKALLNDDFTLNIENIFSNIDENTKLVFLCSPNNPTGNSLTKEDIQYILNKFNGIVVVDEAYFDFSSYISALDYLNEYNNLIVLQTFSKAWGMAGIRLGMAFADSRIIHYFNKVKPPYNVNAITQKVALEKINNIEQKNDYVKIINEEKIKLMNEIAKLSYIKRVYDSDANYFLAKLDDPKKLYKYLVEKSIVVRDRSDIELLEGCLRITVGTVVENIELLKILKEY